MLFESHHYDFIHNFRKFLFSPFAKLSIHAIAITGVDRGITASHAARITPKLLYIPGAALFTNSSISNISITSTDPSSSPAPTEFSTTTIVSGKVYTLIYVPTVATQQTTIIEPYSQTITTQIFSSGASVWFVSSLPSGLPSGLPAPPPISPPTGSGGHGGHGDGVGAGKGGGGGGGGGHGGGGGRDGGGGGGHGGGGGGGGDGGGGGGGGGSDPPKPSDPSSSGDNPTSSKDSLTSTKTQRSSVTSISSISSSSVSAGFSISLSSTDSSGVSSSSGSSASTSLRSSFSSDFTSSSSSSITTNPVSTEIICSLGCDGCDLDRRSALPTGFSHVDLLPSHNLIIEERNLIEGDNIAVSPSYFLIS